MADDRRENTGSVPDAGRPKREPPTIDLEATSSETRHADGASSEPPAESMPDFATAAIEEPRVEAKPAEEPRVDEPAPRPVSPWVVAPISGAVAAALVIGIGWMLGWPAIEPATVSPAAQQNAASIDALGTRVAGIETKASARVDALEKSVAALRSEIGSARAQNDKLASALNDVKSAPRTDSAMSPDLTVFAERIARIESQMRAQNAEIAQQGNKLADTQSADAKAAGDMPWRRVLAATLLDVLVRVGEPFPAALSAAKSLSPNPDALKPLETFADKGVPSPAKLSADLLAVVPKLMPAQPSVATTTGTGIVDRLQAGAARLVKIERTDSAGTDRGAVVGRITALALRNDFKEARRELNTLSPEERAAAQDWLSRADARDAALAASRQFAADAMAELGKPAQ